MSDYHFYQAMDDMISGRSYDEGYNTSTDEDGASFAPDPLYYHINIIAKVVLERGEAYLITFSGLEFFIPKSICKRVEENSIYVHAKIFKQILLKKQSELK